MVADHGKLAASCPRLILAVGEVGSASSYRPGRAITGVASKEAHLYDILGLLMYTLMQHALLILLV